MTRQLLQAVLRSLADVGPPVSDGELLRQFVADRSEAAFGELLRRYGRLVWAVCRHLTCSEAEADDAFQATFLVLIENAGKVRDPGKLSAWLHGVAYKVCARARRSARRREAREQAIATSERNGSPVPESAWDRALAAVHEEVAQLPESLRVPFVLCCLEGKGVTEASAQLGWKLGTFSGRLTRAKDAVLAKLEARGLALGVLGVVGLAVPPATLTAKTVALAQVGCAVPSSVLQLSRGVIGMKSMKLLAATVLLACGLGLGAGIGLVPTAEAQPSAPTTPVKAAPAKADPEAEVRRLQAELLKALTDLAEKQARDARRPAVRDDSAAAVKAAIEALSRRPREETYTAKTKKWEYDFVQVSEMGATAFGRFLQEREDRGWEFNGQSSLQLDGKPGAVWVFRRPARGTPAPAEK